MGGMGEPQHHLKEWRKRAGLTLEQLGNRVGTDKATIQKLEKGDRKLHDEWVRKLSTALGITRSDLYRCPPPGVSFKSEVKPLAEPHHSVADLVRDRIDIEEVDVRASGGAGAMVEIPDEAVRAVWSLPRDLVRSATNSPADRVKILTIIGDSMAPLFMPRDKVMVDTQDLGPTPPGVFVVWDGSGFVIKRVEVLPHSDPVRVRLFSDNPKYTPYERIVGEAYIQGRVIGKWLWT